MSIMPSCVLPREEERFGGFGCENGQKIGSSSRRARVIMDRRRVRFLGLGISEISNRPLSTGMKTSCLMHGLVIWFSMRTTGTCHVYNGLRSVPQLWRDLHRRGFLYVLCSPCGIHQAQVDVQRRLLNSFLRGYRHDLADAPGKGWIERRQLPDLDEE